MYSAASTYSFLFFFFFNDTATTAIYTPLYTLSLHDALPISLEGERAADRAKTDDAELRGAHAGKLAAPGGLVNQKGGRVRAALRARVRSPLPDQREGRTNWPGATPRSGR